MIERQQIGATRRAFTLFELLIVIMILLALGGIVYVGYTNIQKGAKGDLQLVQFDQIEAAMDQFHLYMDRFPTEEEGLVALWKKDALTNEEDAEHWRGPYLKDPIHLDAWGREIVYRNPSEELGEGYYDLVSFGPDGEEGTDDDITNHDRLRNADGEISEEFDDLRTEPPPGG